MAVTNAALPMDDRLDIRIWGVHLFMDFYWNLRMKRALVKDESSTFLELC